MFLHTIAVIALGLGGLDASSQEFAQGYETHNQTLDSVQQQRRFGVQFRQPEWRDYVFGSQQEMEDFIDGKARNGWDVQITGELRVRYRLVQWGGSRIFDTLPEAEAWAAHLERQFGYQARVVDN